MATDFSAKHVDAGIDARFCEHPGCDKWGGFGFSVSKVAPARWWCARHYPYWPDSVKAKYAALPG